METASPILARTPATAPNIARIDPPMCGPGDSDRNHESSRDFGRRDITGQARLLRSTIAAAIAGIVIDGVRRVERGLAIPPQRS